MHEPTFKLHGSHYLNTDYTATYEIIDVHWVGDLDQLLVLSSCSQLGSSVKMTSVELIASEPSLKLVLLLGDRECL